MAPPQTERQPRPAPRPKRARAYWPDRVLIGVSAAYQATSTSFSDTRTFDLHVEQARFTTDYEVAADVAIDGSVLVRLWKGLAAGIGVTRFTNENDIALEASVPHPFFFNQPREVSGSIPGERSELAIHPRLAWVQPAGRRMLIAVYGGPTYFSGTATVVTSFEFDEQFPFDEAQFERGITEEEDVEAWGAHAGVDVSFFFNDVVGIGGLAQFSRGSADLSLESVDVGGFQAGGGIRIKIR